MPRKTSNPDEVATTNGLASPDRVRVAPLGVFDSDEAMRKHGAHVWTDTKKGQTFWCFCDNDKDHQSEPRFQGA